MQIDFIVHPGFADPDQEQEPNYSHKEIFQNYLDSIVKSLEGSDCVILLQGFLTYEKENKIKMKIKPDYLFTTDVHVKRFYGQQDIFKADTGYLKEEDLNSLKQLIDQPNISSVRIHGSYFGMCVLAIVQQLYALWECQLLMSLQNVYFGRSSNGYFSELRVVEQDRKRVISWDRDIQNPRVYAPLMPEYFTWGTVLYPPWDGAIFGSCNEVKDGHYFPYGNIEYQLLTPHSKVYATAMPEEYKELAIQRGATVILPTRDVDEGGK